MTQLCRIIALSLALFAGFAALAQTNQGTSPLTGSKGGTNNAYMQFSGPASSMKTYTLPNASGTVDLLNAVQTISAAKTFNDLTLLLAGSTSGTTTLKASAAASGVLTLPAATDTLVARNTADTLTNKTLTSPTLTTPSLGVATATSINKVAITPPATAATLTIPDGVTLTGPAASGTAMTLGNAETITGAKSFNDTTMILKGATSGATTMKAGAVAGATTVTLPAATDTLIGKATTDTLTNKTFDTAGAGNSLSINGVAATANTGTGAIARAVSPVFTTPTLGAASATTINKLTLTGPATGATLTLLDGTIITGPAATGTLATLANAETLSSKTFDTASNTFKLNGAAFGTATQATAALNPCVGDSGSGGTKGIVPAPGAGDFAAGKFLDASCSWSVPAGGGGGGGLSDTDRRNILLDRIYQSKLYGGYRRVINAFADGYKAGDGIDASSSNYLLNTASGFVAPTSTGGTDQLPTMTSATTSGVTISASSFYNSNAVYAAWHASDKVVGTNAANHWCSAAQAVTWTVDFGSGNEKTITQYTIQPRATDGANNAPSSFTFEGSNDNSNWTVLDTQTAVTTGWVAATVRTFPVFSNSTAYRYYRFNITTNVVGGATTCVTEFTLRSAVVFGSMTLVTTAQTSDASVSNGRVLIEYDNAVTPALNTDLTTEVTCDGGTNWASATLSSVSSNSQAGRKIAESVDRGCTSGTSFAARIKTLNSKNVPIYGTSLMVH